MAAPPARLGVLALGAGYFLSQFYRSFLAVMSPALEADLGLGDFALSNAQAVWFASFALAQFPVGWALDRFGPRWTTTLLMGVGCSGGAALFALAQAPWMIVAAMGLIGVGVSSVLMASLYLYARLFPARRFAANTALVIGFGALGNVLAAAPLSGMIDALGWRGATLAMAAVSAVVTLAIAALVRDPQRAEAAPGAGGAGFFAGLGAVLALRPLWAILPLMTFSYAATASLRGVWIGPYLADVFGYDSLEIGWAATAMALAIVVGAVLYAPLDRIFGTRKGVAFAGNALVAALLTALALAPDADSALSVSLFALIGLAGLSYSVIMAHGSAYLPEHLIGRGVTLLNFCAIAGSGLLQYLSGAVHAGLERADAPALAFSGVFALYAVLLAGALAVYAASRDAPPTADR